MNHVLTERRGDISFVAEGHSWWLNYRHYWFIALIHHLNLDVGKLNAHHKTGRTISTNVPRNIHDHDKWDFYSIGRYDGSSTADWELTVIKYGVTTAAVAGE